MILIGDCLDHMATLPAGSVDCVISDPPYRTISGGTSSSLVAGWKTSVLSKNDGKIFQHNDTGFDSYLPALHRVMREGSHLYLMTNNLNLRACLNAIERHGFYFHNLLRWDKNTKTANRWYMKDCEYTAFAAKRPVKPINNMGSAQGFRFDNPRSKRHPTEKPVELMEHYLLNSTQPGETVLDPFAGSGATAIAAINTGRNWIYIEKDAEYAAAARQRIAERLLG